MVWQQPNLRMQRSARSEIVPLPLTPLRAPADAGVGLPPWRVTPSRWVFSPSSLASLKTRPNSDDGSARRSSSVVTSSELLHCRLLTHIGHLSSQPVVPPSWTPLFPLDRRCVARFDGAAQLVPTCFRLVALRHDCAGPPIGAGSSLLLRAQLLSSLPHPPCRCRAPLPSVCRALPPVSLMRWRPTIACSGARAARSFRSP